MNGTVLTTLVRTRVYQGGTSSMATGSFDTPVNNATGVVGSLPVTGWALDDVAVSRVDIYRDPVTGEGATPVFLGNGSFIAGARPDVEGLSEEYPLNYRAGWGFMILTNMLPNANGVGVGGNGTYRLHAYAIDAEGRAAYLGAKMFTSNNSTSNKPFGTLDTPTQGGTASGAGFAVFGWALSKTQINPNGSTIDVYVDGVNVGHPVYNNNRADIAGLFPGLPNSTGAIGYYILNTLALANGTHTISWVVRDNGNNTEGIGSRFFTVQNTAGASTAAPSNSAAVASAAGAGAAVGVSAAAVDAVPADYAVLEVKKAAADDATPEVAFPDASGDVTVTAKETEQVEVTLSNWYGDGGTYEGYVVINGRMRPLPAGSTLDKAAGVFKWQPGPGFVGSYKFVFLRTLPGGSKTRIPVNVTISPKFDSEK